MKPFLTYISCILIGFALSLLYQNFKRPFFKPPPFQNLQLTSEQEVKIKNFHEERKEEERKLEDLYFQERKNLETLFQKNEDTEIIKDLFKNMLILKNNLEIYRFETILYSRKLFTPEQLTKLPLPPFDPKPHGEPPHGTSPHDPHFK